MFQIPDYPLRRTQAYLTEAGGPLRKAWWHRRWIPEQVPVLSDRLLLPHRSDLSAKDTDPDWRQSWDNWVLLTYHGDLGCYVFYASNEENLQGMRTLLPVRTRLFAMRIGNNPVEILIAPRNRKAQVWAPSFFQLRGIKTFIRPYEQVLVFCQNIGQDVTFI